MTRKPIFWIVFALLFVGCVVFTLEYFSSAYPIVTLDLKMDRRTALESAQELVHRYGWGPGDFRQAATFRVDTQVQHFVELEIGGAEAFAEMLKEGLYSPYTWRVRHFEEGETNETLVRFTPDGQPYGFVERLPEAEPGPSLSDDSALKIAETDAGEKWGIDLAGFRLVEKSQEVRPGGRTDHTFVYERPDVRIGDGTYRLRLVVGGDRLTELTHFVKIPEAFSRRYQEMRSANNTITMSAMVGAAILYVVGGCIVGLFLLLRQRWVLWRKALFWGLFVAFLNVLVQINQWPLAWMDYDTALSAQGFLFQQIMQLVVIFVGMGLLLTVTFMAAESLTRKAFPKHIQFWRLWSSDTGGSPNVFGRTMGGYLAVGLFLAFDVALYLFATRVLGWWTPSEALFQPDVLATYFPWLTSIAISVHAGFWEECLFRAIPIAGAALLGQRFGKRGIWIVGAFIVQALIFGGGHASYPQQPAYARVVELIIPSVGFGLIYLYFGLLPAIILHYAVDVVYFAMPLFVSSAPGIWVDRVLVIVLTFVPLFVLVWRRIRAREWQEVQEENYNQAWQPPEKIKSVPVETKVEKMPSMGSKRYWVVLVAGLLGLVVWFFASNFDNVAPSLTLGRKNAEELARKTVAERGVELPASWRLLSTVQAPLGGDDRFVWQNEGEEKYRELLGPFMSPPRWELRFVQFEGEVAERAEEYQVFVAQEDEIQRFRHTLPEARAGASLTEEAARTMAHSVLAEKYQLDASTLKEVSAEPSQLPERKDWLFTFADTLNHPLKEGEARIGVKISGDEVTDTYRYIHVPEEWERQERNRDNQRQIIQMFIGIMIFLLFVAGVIGAIIQWSRKAFSVSGFLVFFVFLFALGVVNLFNRWPATMAQFSTAEPLTNQTFLAIALSLVGLLFVSAGTALVVGFVMAWKTKPSESQSSPVAMGMGFALGMLLAGIAAVVSMLFEPSLEPLWASYDAVSNTIPVLRDGLGPITGYILSTTLFLLIFTAVDRFSRGWTRRKVLLGIGLVLVIFIVRGSGVDSLSFWLISGLISGIVYLLAYLFVFRFQLALVPLTLGAAAILGVLRQGLMNSYPTAIPGAVLGMVCIGVVSVYWYKRLSE